MSTNLQCTVIYSLLHIQHRDFIVFVAFFICLNANCTYQWLNTRDEGTIKTPIPECRLSWCFCLGWWSNFVGSESGQKQSAKLLQNMVYNTTQHPPHPLPPLPHSLYILYVYFGKGGRGGGGHREGRGATVHKRGRKYQHDWLYLQSVTLLNTIKDDI